MRHFAWGHNLNMAPYDREETNIFSWSWFWLPFFFFHISKMKVIWLRSVELLITSQYGICFSQSKTNMVILSEKSECTPKITGRTWVWRESWVSWEHPKCQAVVSLCWVWEDKIASKKIEQVWQRNWDNLKVFESWAFKLPFNLPAMGWGKVLNIQYRTTSRLV